MNPDPTSAKSIFLSALEIADAAERKAFVAARCAGDNGLLGDVERLLHHHAAQSSFLESPVGAGGETTDSTTGAEQPGAVIGSYRLLEQIGEGGFGVVFMAEQSRPVQRRVALKIIKPGMDSKQVVARFEAERQALAVMDHVNIARVIDGGTTESGRPYFVMELVHGIPITKYCDDNHLTPRERLELFVPVCHAIQHAHQKGIIHRDVKPSNVLVTLYDGKPVPKVIDFGVAKATEQKLTERTLFTNYGTMVGTLEYMSPEQAELSALGVDTRSDIYSLGVLLYELLTGSTPLSRKRVKEAAFDEILRIIREEEPPKPSARLSDSGDALASISVNRHMEPAKLTKLLRGELDWIVMKCLEKDRSRRYETVNGFAMDVQRYLADEPVQACPPSAWYRFKKFVRRNRASVLAAGTVAAALLIGTAVASWQAVLATRAKSEAQAKEAEANAVVKFFEDHVFAAGRPKGKYGGLGHEVSLQDAVNAGVSALATSFKDQPLVEARLRFTLGSTFGYLGQNDQALEQFEQSRALFTRHRGAEHASTLASVDGIANSYSALGRHTEALKLNEETLEIRKRVLSTDHPDTLRSMTNLASSYYALGRHAEALKLREETLEAQRRIRPKEHPDTQTGMSNLANSYYASGREGEALKLREETLAIRKRVLPKDHPDTFASMTNLAISYSFVGRHAEAVELRQEALEVQKQILPKDHPDTLASMNNLAMSYSALGRHAEALKLREETLEIRRRVLPKDHPDTLRSMNNLAASYSDLGRDAEALKLQEETLAIQRRVLPKDHPDTLWSMSNLATSCAALGRHAEALKLREETLEAQSRILPKDHPVRLGSMVALAMSYSALGRHAEALKLQEETLAIQRRVLPKDHADTLATMHNLALSYSALRRDAEALKLREETLETRRRVLPKEHLDTLRSMSNLALSYSALRRHAEALKLHEETLAIQRRVLPKDHPDTLRTMHNLAISCAALGRHAEALKLREETLAFRRRVLPKDHPATLSSMTNLAVSYSALGRHAEALKLQEETLAIQRRVLPQDHPETLMSIFNLAFNNGVLGRYPEALKLVEEFLPKADLPGLDRRLFSEAIGMRLECYQKAGDPAGCRTSAELMEKRNPSDVGSLYNAACFRAITAATQAKAPGADAPRLAKEDADKAMAWLRKCVAAGFKDVAHMKKDADLDSLRDRDDFKKLIADLEAKSK